MVSTIISVKLYIGYLGRHNVDSTDYKIFGVFCSNLGHNTDSYKYMNVNFSSFCQVNELKPL